MTNLLSDWWKQHRPKLERLVPVSADSTLRNLRRLLPLFMGLAIVALSWYAVHLGMNELKTSNQVTLILTLVFESIFLLSLLFVMGHLAWRSFKKHVPSRQVKNKGKGEDESEGKDKHKNTPEEKRSVLGWIIMGVLFAFLAFVMYFGITRVIIGDMPLGIGICLVALVMFLLLLGSSTKPKQTDKPLKKKKSFLVWVLKIVVLVWLILGIAEWAVNDGLRFAYQNGLLNDTPIVTRYHLLPPYVPPVERPEPRKPGD